MRGQLNDVFIAPKREKKNSYLEIHRERQPIEQLDVKNISANKTLELVKVLDEYKKQNDMLNEDFQMIKSVYEREFEKVKSLLKEKEDMISAIEEEKNREINAEIDKRLKQIEELSTNGFTTPTTIRIDKNTASAQKKKSLKTNQKLEKTSQRWK